MESFHPELLMTGDLGPTFHHAICWISVCFQRPEPGRTMDNLGQGGGFWLTFVELKSGWVDRLPKKACKVKGIRHQKIGPANPGLRFFFWDHFLMICHNFLWFFHFMKALGFFQHSSSCQVTSLRQQTKLLEVRIRLLLPGDVSGYLAN